MKLISRFVTTFSLVFLMACSGASETDTENTSSSWTLNPISSGITYVTIKNGSLGEINTFREISGTVSKSGKAEFIVNLNSVDTNNEIRDPRMREILFETDKFPSAKVSANLDMSEFEDLSIGSSKTVLLDMTLDLHGISEQFDFYVLVTRLGPNKVKVDNKAPLLLDAEDFGLGDGLAKLQELAGLESISPVVSATVALTFER
ncbi:MAG: YceI family protein [Litorimonas sp.]